MTVYYRILDSHWHKDSAIAGAVLASDKHGRVRIVESDTNIAFALLGEDIEKISRVEADDQIFAGVVDFDFFGRSEEHTSELQSLMRNSYAVFCLKKKKKKRV